MFRNRNAAGKELATKLTEFACNNDVTVLGMARGGVVVARQVAQSLGAPLEVFVARKLGVPGVEETAFGAIAENGKTPFLDAVAKYIGIPDDIVAQVARRERLELDRRVQCYRGGRPLPDLRSRIVIVVDDGLASGATLRAAALAIRRQKPGLLIAAVPVASAAGVREIAGVFDQIIALVTPESFELVSDWYDDFQPVTDAEVREIMSRPSSDVAMLREAPGEEREVRIPLENGGASLNADLGTSSSEPSHECKGLVVFAHGGGSSRKSYRNRYLAARLRFDGWTTLRVDLLTDDEMMVDDVSGASRFDIDLLSRRLKCAVQWCLTERVPGHWRVILFGASTGAAAAVTVAADLQVSVAAIVARGGRIDLAGDDCARVRVPALLIVGGADRDTLAWNKQSRRKLAGPSTLRVVRGAGHTFEEIGALGRVGELTAGWLRRRS